MHVWTLPVSDSWHNNIFNVCKNPGPRFTIYRCAIRNQVPEESRFLVWKNSTPPNVFQIIRNVVDKFFAFNWKTGIVLYWNLNVDDSIARILLLLRKYIIVSLTVMSWEGGNETYPGFGIHWRPSGRCRWKYR